ncbi:MAG TPA: hypothetical protein VJ890_03975 [Vineibacter sp.]|nr:hypothetical protein [Vineibacter sp.]
MADPSLELLQAMVQRVLDSVVRLESGQSEIIHRVGHLERETANLHQAYAAQSVRLDNISERLSRIERRIGLIEA